MAVPAVLASISTKNALANPIYGCTVSGKMSGNASPGLGREETSSCGGRSPDGWKSHYSTDPSGSLEAPSGFGVSHKTAGSVATRKLVFAKSNKIKFSYSQQVTLDALAVYCNAEPGNYHVSTDEVHDLFEVASGQVTEYTKNQHTWYKDDCADYLAMLARGVPFTWPVV